MRKKNIIFALAAASLLAACGYQGGASSSNSLGSSEAATSEESSVASSLAHVSIDEKDVLGVFGDYIGDNGSLHIDGEGVHLEKEGKTLDLEPVKASTATITDANEQSTTVQVYLAKNGFDNYRFYLDPSAGYLVMEKKTVHGYLGKGDAFLPIIKKAAGRYGYQGFIDSPSSGYIFDNTFDEDSGLFQVTFSGPTFAAYNRYAQTYKQVKGGEVVSGIYLIDGEDGSIMEHGQFVFSKDKVDIVQFDEEGKANVVLSSDVGFLQGDYYDLKSKEDLRFALTSEGYDEDYNALPGKISLNGNEGVSFTKAIEEDGLHVKFSIGNDSYDAQPGVFGLRLAKNGESDYLPYDSLLPLRGKFDYQLTSFEFDGESVKYNGKAVAWEKTLAGLRLGISFEADGKAATFIPYISGTAVIGQIAGEENVYLNNDLFASYFVESYSARQNNKLTGLSIAEDLTYSSTDSNLGSGQGYFSYDISNKSVSYVLGESGYTFRVVSSGSIYALSKGEQMVPYFLSSDVNSLYDSYTSHHAIDLVLDEEKLSDGKSSVGYDLGVTKDRNGDYQMSIISSLGKALVYPDSHSFYLFNPEGKSLGAYIGYEAYLGFNGNYFLNGKNGKEGFYIDAANGVFKADTPVKKADGSFDHYDKVEYSYTLDSTYNSIDGKAHAALAWTVPSKTGGSGAVVYGYQYPGAFQVFGTYYVKEAIYDAYGLYADGSSNLVYLHDYALAVNGTSMAISSYSEDENGFSLGNGSKTLVKEGDAFKLGSASLSKVAGFDIAKMVGVYKTADEKYSVEIKGVTDEIMQVTTYAIYVNGSSAATEIAFTYVDGKIAISSSIIGGKLNLCLQEDGTWALTYEASFLPPPPPPAPSLK